MASQYSFPLLSDQDMCDFLRDIGYPFRNEWKKPTAAMVQYIYPALVEIVIGIDSERLSHPEQFAMDKHDINKDVYARGLPELGMLLMIFQVMEACCIFNFSFRDITNPTWSRLHTILSGVINFVRFQHEFFDIFENSTTKTQEMEAKITQMKETLQELQDKYQNYLLSPEVIEFRQLQKHREALLEKLAAKRAQRKQLELQCNEALPKLKQATESLSTTDKLLSGLQHELQLLKMKDITGVLHDIETLRTNIEIQLQNSSLNQYDIAILRAKNDFIKKFDTVLNLLLDEYQSYDESVNMYKRSLQNISRIENELKVEKEKKIALNKQYEEVLQALSDVKDDVHKTSKEYDELLHEKDVQIKHLLSELDSYNTSQESILKQTKSLQNKIEQLHNDMITEQKHHEQLLYNANQRIQSLTIALEKFHTNVGKSLGFQQYKDIKHNEDVSMKEQGIVNRNQKEEYIDNDILDLVSSDDENGYNDDKR